MKYLLGLVIVLQVVSAQALQCKSVFKNDDKIVKGELLEARQSASTIHEFLQLDQKLQAYKEELHHLSAGAHRFVELNLEFITEVFNRHNYPPQALESLRVLPIFMDPKYAEDHLTFVVVGEHTYYFSKNPGKIDPGNVKPGWYQVESSQIGFMAREKKQIVLDEQAFLVIESTGKVYLLPRQMKDSRFLVKMAETDATSENQRAFIKEFLPELTEALESTSLTNKEILENTVIESIVVESGEKVFILSAEHGDFYFTHAKALLDNSNHKKWGLLGESSIGFRSGSESELITENGLHIKLQPGNSAKYFLTEGDGQFEALAQNSQGKAKEFFAEFAAEIKELYRDQIIGAEDFVSNNLMLAVSKKTGKEFFVLQKSEDDWIYFADNASEFHSSSQRWGYLEKIDTKKQGSEFEISVYDVRIALPAGFSLKPVVKTVLNEDRYEYMMQQQQAMQARQAAAGEPSSSPPAE